MRFWSPASKKWLEKSLRGSKENFLKRVILDRRRYNKAVGGITKPQGNIGNRGKSGYIISNEFIISLTI